MALDVGTKRTGVALSDETGIIASPLTVIEAVGKKDWAKRIEALIAESSPIALVVGLPLNQFGEEGEDARKIREYITLLRERLTLPVIEWDERFTTIQAERTLLEGDVSRRGRKQVIDKLAAAILLQSYLDHKHFRNTPEWEN